MMKIKFDWDDILIEMAPISDINSRKKEIVIDKLPLYVSPMDTVVDESNAILFIERGYEVCLPRHISYIESLSDCFFSYGLSQINDIIENGEIKENKVLIDIANGNMRALVNTIRSFKKKYPDKILMVGNVANPETVLYLSKAGADIIRIGVGNGGGCLTTQNVGVGAAMGSLVKESKEVKERNNLKVKLIADGGFKNYDEVIKALAVGAEGVMLGSILNKTLESSGEFFIDSDNGYLGVTNEEAIAYYNNGIGVYKSFRGMSTKEVQIKWGKKTLTTSEGVTKKNKVEYTLDGWTNNFIDYLKTAMSYTNKKDLKGFIGKVNYNFITVNALNRFRK